MKSAYKTEHKIVFQHTVQQREETAVKHSRMGAIKFMFRYKHSEHSGKKTRKQSIALGEPTKVLSLYTLSL